MHTPRLSHASINSILRSNKMYERNEDYNPHRNRRSDNYRTIRTKNNNSQGLYVSGIVIYSDRESKNTIILITGRIRGIFVVL